jgi:glucose/arabinose dehydrogenase
MPPTFDPTLMPDAKRPLRAKHVIVAILVLLGAAAWIVQSMRKGSFEADPTGVSMVTASRPAEGDVGVMPNVFITAYLNNGHAIDPDPKTLNTMTVRLYRADDQYEKPVPAEVTTSAAGDDIVLKPIQVLEGSTKYTFEVKGVKDRAGADLLPYKMSFTTSAAATTSKYPAAFEKVQLPSDQEHYTGLAIGPDHRLYAGTADGKIIRRGINADGTLGESKVIKALQAANHAPRVITGIEFDPKCTADNPVLWISHGQFLVNQRGEFSREGYSEWTGKISTLSGPDLSDYRDVVVGLPRSWRDHLNNEIDFGPDGCIYWSQGSHTAMGAPDKKWGGNRVERLLSAAVLRLDPTKVNGTLDVKTPDGGGTYNPFAPDAPLTIYASGVRVGFDMLWHSNGHLYTAVNGSAQGGNTPGSPAGDHSKFPRRIDSGKPYDGPDVPPVENVDQTQPDLLLKLEKGGYYGHPNPSRGEYVLNGGNPTAARDPLEVSKYPVGTQPDRNWRKPAFDFGTSVSPNGMIEYKGAGELNGKMMITRLNGNDIIVVSLDQNGDVAETITGIAGMTNFKEPLGLTEDESTGNIYVAEYFGQNLSLLRPITDAARMAEMQTPVFRQQVRASAGD